MSSTLIKPSQKNLGKHSYSKKELLACCQGELFGKGNSQLPLPNMLMFDSIVHISHNGGIYDKGEVIAKLGIRPDLWFFDCHFHEDPVMPGCLGLDALWQLLGFFLGWTGGIGRGRALGAGEVKFSGQILPTTQEITYRVNIKQTAFRKISIGVADGQVLVDNKLIYKASNLKVGLFVNTNIF